jgi:indole-3-glycerol phosphate synthase
VAVIAELKKASPSKGLLRNDFDVEKIAQAYASAGAAALSVLTEEDFFLGLPDHLTRVANSTTLPVLRKDFIYSSYQIWEAAGLGADAVLLIVAMLSDGELRDLLQVAADAGVAALTEVHNRAELRHALTHGAKIVGVNNRDLRDFSVNVNLALELIDDIPEGVLAVAESGLQTAADLERMAKAGYDAVLIGEHFMKAPDPGAALAELLRNTHALRK